MIRRLVALLSLSLSPLMASQSGTFHYGKVKFEPVDSFAYQAETQQPGKPLTIVVLTDFTIDRPAVLAAINTPGAFVLQSGEKGSFAMLRLVSPEKCGVGGFLAPTQQQFDLSDNLSAKTTASTSSRVAGECWTSKPGKMFEDTYDFHLTYDVPITVIPKPAVLPAGGGEAGAAYLALVKAIQTANWDAAHAHLRTDEVPKTRPKAAADMKQYFDGLALNYPKSATVTGGLIKGDRANIDIKGIHHDGHKINGVVALKKVDGQWQVLEQNFYSEQ
jgi:hypothetical protein